MIEFTKVAYWSINENVCLYPLYGCSVCAHMCVCVNEQVYLRTRERCFPLIFSLNTKRAILVLSLCFYLC